MHRLSFSALALGLAAAAAAPAQTLSYQLGDFDAADWSVVNITDDGPASVTMQALTDLGNSFWLITFGVPQTSSSFTATNRMAAIYMGQAYDPAALGALTTLNFSADVRPFSNSFAFSSFGVLRPALMQNGVVYTVPTSNLNPTAPSDYQPHQWTLAADASWVSATGLGSPDFSASGAPIYAGFRFQHGIQCTSAAGCRGGNTILGVDNFGVQFAAAPVPEPAPALLLAAGLAALRWRRRFTRA